MAMLATKLFDSMKFSATAWRRRGASAFVLLLVAIGATPATAGINYGRDVFGPNLIDYIGPVCTPGCSTSQTCTKLYSSNTDPVGTNLCVNNTYAFNYMGNWQPLGRAYAVGDVVTDSLTGKAYIFIDVSASTAVTTNLDAHPPLTDTNSWQSFTALVTDSAGSQGSAGPAGPRVPRDRKASPAHKVPQASPVQLGRLV